MREQVQQGKERLNTLRALNKQLEGKAEKNYALLRRDQAFREEEEGKKVA